MTIGEIIAHVDELKPNLYQKHMKIKWLSDVEGNVIREILNIHEREEGSIDFKGYETEETELLVPEPYTDLYVYYLMAQIDFAQAEYDRYNNATIRFNEAYDRFRRWYNQKHRPITPEFNSAF